MNDQTLNTLMIIIQFVFYITLTTAAIYFMISIKKAVTSVTNIEKEASGIAAEITPVISEIKILITDVKNLTDNTSDQMEKIIKFTDTFMDKGNDIINVIDKVQMLSGNYLSNGVNFISAVGKGFKTLSTKLKN